MYNIENKLVFIVFPRATTKKKTKIYRKRDERNRHGTKRKNQSKKKVVMEEMRNKKDKKHRKQIVKWQK